MSEYIPLIQYEIRFNHILDFSRLSTSLLSPFIRLTNSLKVEKEGRLDQTINLFFDDNSYQVIATWDRLIFKGKGSLKNLKADNSPIDEPFFNIFNRIKSLDSFSEVQNHLLYVIWIDVGKYGKTKEEVVKDFKEIYFKNNLAQIGFKENDVALSLVYLDEMVNRSINIGPFLGKSDLELRNLPVLDEYKDAVGRMAEYKCLEITQSVDLSKFHMQLDRAQESIKKSCLK